MDTALISKRLQPSWDEESEDDEELLLLEESVVLMLATQQRSFRRYWIHDTISKRCELVEYHRFIRELEADDNRFKMYFRMTKHQFNALL